MWGAWPLIGRERELQRVAAAISDPAGTGVLFAGEAGVGKSRLSRECLLAADRNGIGTRSVLATRSAATIPFGPFATLIPARAQRPSDRASFLHMARSAIEELAAERRLVLSVDDANLLDPLSAVLLHQLAESGRVFLVVTIRSGDPAPDAVTGLWKDGLLDRVDLGPLTQAECGRLVESVLGGPVDGATQWDLWRGSRGNVLVLRELLLGALDAGFLTRIGPLWRLARPLTTTPRLVDLIEARLADLTEAEREALDLVALAEPIDVTMLAGLAALTTVLALENRGLVTVDTDSEARSVRLAHPFYGEVVRVHMPALRKLLAFRRLADAADASPAAEQPDLLRGATWRLEAGGRVEPARMVEAGRRALFAHDEQLAERLARAAMDAGGGIAAALLLGEVLSALGRHGDAEQLLASLQLDDAVDELVALVAIRRAAALFYGLNRRSDALAVLAEAEGRLAETSWRDEVVCVYAGYELLNERPAAALRAVQPALDGGAGRALVEAAVIAAPALAVTGRGADAVDVARRGLAARMALGDQYGMAGASLHLTWQALGLMEAGELAQAEAVLLKGYDSHIEDRTRRGQAWYALTLGRLRHFQGRPLSAIRAFAESAAAFGELGENGLLRLCLGGQVIAMAWRGEQEAAAATMAALQAVGDDPLLLFEADVDRARGWAAVVAGDADTGKESFRTAARRAATSQSWALEAAAWHDLARVGEPAEAAARMTELAPLVTGSLIPARAAYVTALARADPPGLLAAGDRFEQIGASLYAAEAVAAAGQRLRAVGRAQDAATAFRRVQRLIGSCEGSCTAALGGLTQRALTKREYEIVDLAARGLSNRAIAEQLFVSVRTVENHLRRGYDKLGVRSRDELADALARQSGR